MSTGILDINDHGEVYIACKPVSSKWRDIAARLGVLENTLATIEADYRVEGVERCMSAVIGKWLRRPEGEVSVDGRVLPTWRNLCVALSPIDGGLAEGIALEHDCNYKIISPAVSKIASHSDVPPVFLTESCGCNKCTVKEWRSRRKCQSIFHDNRPKVLLANPDHPMVAELILFERSYDRQIRLCVETDTIAKSFKIVSSDTWNHLNLFDEAKISKIAFEFGIWLRNSPFLNSGMECLSSVCHDLRVSWFNFSPLHYLAEQYLFPLYPDVESNWSNYCAVFKEYCSNRHLTDYTDVFFKVENHNIFLLEIDERYYNFTLADVESLRESLSIALDVSSVSLHLVTVKTGSVIIYFYYCYSDYLTRFKSLSSQQLKMIAMIKLHRILSLTDLYNLFEYNDIQRYYYYEDSSSTELQLWKKRAPIKDIGKKIEQTLKDKLEKKTDQSGALFVKLPDLTNHLVALSEDVLRIIGETERLIDVVKSNSKIQNMQSVTHALIEIQRFVSKGYEYIDLLECVPYYFHRSLDGEALLSDYENVKARIEKGGKCLADSVSVYEFLNSYCSDAQRSCDTAADELGKEAESEESKKKAAQVTGGVLGTAGIGTVIALSVVAGIFTFGIGTVAGLATTAAVASAAGVGAGVAGAVYAQQYSESAENFRKLSSSLSQLSRHAIALFELTSKMRTSLRSISANLKYSESHVLLTKLKRDGQASYSITSLKRQEVYLMKNSIAEAIHKLC